MNRPVIIIGNGVHLAHAEERVREFCRAAGCPIVSTWAGADIAPDLPLYIGSFGLFGSRAANFVVQNADYLVVIGASLSVPQTGYNRKHFARGAHIDQSLNWTLPYLNVTVELRYNAWNERCLAWRERYGIEQEPRERDTRYVNSFDFIREWSESLPKDAIVVTDMGTSFTCTFQAARMKYGQRWLTASGFAPMGYALPGAIGAHYATGKPVWCLVGDGALQFNLATLQQIRDLPIKVIVFDNGGYLTMKHTFTNHYGHKVGSEFDFSNIAAIAEAMGVADQVQIVHMDPMQPLTPRIAGMKLPDGSITSRPLEDMFPFLDREQLKREMIVPMVDV